MSEVIDIMSKVFVNTYLLYLKTQAYHWNVKGSNFFVLHEVFEEQYRNLAEAVDSLAERSIFLNEKIEANLKYFEQNREISDANVNLHADDMVKDLINSHQQLALAIRRGIKLADETNDIVTNSILTDRLQWHEKTIWMLKSSV